MSKKKVLYIGTPIFDYYKHIIDEFESLGYDVDYYNDRPSERSIVKGLIKIRKNWMSILIQKYFGKILEETKNKQYDLVFFINCKVFTAEMIGKLRNAQKEARFVLYMWDSLTLYPYQKNLFSLFDQSYSFDSQDCEENPALTLLPLFYSKPYRDIKEAETADFEYDIVSICTAHPIRYQIMHRLFPKLESVGIRIYSFMFLNRLQFIYYRMFVKEFRHAKIREFAFRPLSEAQNVEILRKSNTVFDIQHNKQSGLTMRTIETLGAGRKLITTNRAIQKYDFYNDKNILIFDEKNTDGIPDFIRQAYIPIDEAIYKKYSLTGWIAAIVNESR